MRWDRTTEDVEKAKTALGKIKQGEALTREDEEAISKGFLRLSDVREIEDMISANSDMLTEWGYFPKKYVLRSWNEGDLFTDAHLKEWCDRVSALKHSFYDIPQDTSTPKPLYHFEEINRLSFSLESLKNAISAMEDSVRRSGAVNSAQVILPLKRSLT